MRRICFCFALSLCVMRPAAAQDPIIFTVAGGGPNNVPALEAGLGGPQGVAVDPSGNVYIASWGLNRVFKVDPFGILTTVAGNGVLAFAGDGGPATEARLAAPTAVAIDDDGNLYIADTQNHRVRRVDPTGTITTVAGNGHFGFSADGGPATAASIASPCGVAIDGDGNLYIAEQENHRVRRVDPAGIIHTAAGTGAFGFSGDGGAATAASLARPAGLAVDSNGELYIADQFNNRIRRVDSTGTISTVAGNGLFEHSGDGGPATAAGLASPIGVAVDIDGTLYIGDFWNQSVRRVDPAGTISKVAGGLHGYSGDGGPAIAANLAFPAGVAVDLDGNLYIADLDNHRIRVVTPDQTINTLAGNGSPNFSGDGGPATDASLFKPRGVAFDSAGNFYIADQANQRVRKMDQSGNITTVAGNGFWGISADGGQATASSLADPWDVAVDSTGNLYIAEGSSNRIRRVDPAGTITTAAGGIPGPVGVAVDNEDDLYIASSHRVSRVDPLGTIITVAGGGSPGFSGDGGPATAASLNSPSDVALDADGNLYIADFGNSRIRKVDPAGIITTIAGDGLFGFSGDGGPATAARLSGPNGVAVDGDGNLWIADLFNRRVRKVDPAGTITTVAGNGEIGFTGDGGPAAAASLDPWAVAVDSDGSLYIVDHFHDRIRLVSLATNADTDGDGVLDADDPCPAVAQGPSQLDFTGSLLVATDAGGLATVQLQAVLTDTSGAPVAGQEVVFSMTGALGTFTPECPGTTDASGVASCTLEQVPPDLYTVSIDFQEVPGCFDASAEDVFVTVFDPDQPRATGGGFFYPDAESTLPSTQDKAHFAFSIAIEKNKAAAGNLQFKYAAAGIVLESQAMSWYTVSNNKAMFQGVGSINGTGTFTFRVQATDGDKTGQPDHFDIVIWAGTNTESDPFHRAKNQVAGGNIMIQKK